MSACGCRVQAVIDTGSRPTVRHEVVHCPSHAATLAMLKVLAKLTTVAADSHSLTGLRHRVQGLASEARAVILSIQDPREVIAP